MNLLKKFGDLVSPNDPELIEKTLVWMEQQDQWNDVFSTKLIELLDGMDGARSELRTNARNAETIAETSRLGLEKKVTEFQENLRGEVRKAIQTIESQARQAKQDFVVASRDLANAKLAHSQAEKSLQLAITSSESARLGSELASREANEAKMEYERSKKLYRKAASFCILLTTAISTFAVLFAASIQHPLLSPLRAVWIGVGVTLITIAMVVRLRDEA